MPTLQDAPQHRDRMRTRPGAKVLGLTTLAAIGLALLILVPTNHRATAPSAGSIAKPASQTALTAQTPASCFRDPANHALTCHHAAPAPTATPAPAGYFRDPATHKLLRIPVARHRAGPHPANHSRGRIIP